MSIESVSGGHESNIDGAYQALYALGIFGGPWLRDFFKNDWLGSQPDFISWQCSGWRLFKLAFALGFSAESKLAL
ncbi:MFS transporter [Bacillus velezensis]|uniref:MFS transporter n=1 Tax=Bacillus velezensis TaxID=492670 RepID=UPI00111F1A6D|nr:MFS transporter [Bacillus velezensis]TNU30608.1 MFS transporter [Bacillus velezensis]